jgi:hypothetical protein
MAKKKASASSYYELLQHPEWQKVRLQVMERAGWACETCDDSEKQLTVHHSYYEKGKKPWEYPLQSLHCLCRDCHKEAQDLKTLLNRQLGRIDVTSDIEQLYGYARGLEAMSFPDTVLDVSSGEVAQGIAHAWELTSGAVINALRESTIDGHKLHELRTQARLARQGKRTN